MTRAPPNKRSHETYKQDRWTVVDIGHVDKVFSSWSSGDRGQPQVRIDIDGEIVQSVMNDVGEPGENINTSIWLEVPDAKALVGHLDDAIEEAGREAGEGK